MLNADDDDETREVLVWCMRAAGWFVSEASDGWEALSAAWAAVPDAIVMDIDMPWLNGLEALARLRLDGRTARVPVVVCSGMNRPAVKARARALGCDGFVEKPCAPEDLLALVDGLTRDKGRG